MYSVLLLCKSNKSIILPSLRSWYAVRNVECTRSRRVSGWGQTAIVSITLWLSDEDCQIFWANIWLEKTVLDEHFDIQEYTVSTYSPNSKSKGHFQNKCVISFLKLFLLLIFCQLCRSWDNWCWRHQGSFSFFTWVDISFFQVLAVSLLDFQSSIWHLPHYTFCDINF